MGSMNIGFHSLLHLTFPVTIIVLTPYLATLLLSVFMVRALAFSTCWAEVGDVGLEAEAGVPARPRLAGLLHIPVGLAVGALES
jgi:hypothetical protein